MFTKRGFIFLIFISLVVHVLSLSALSLYIENTNTPFILSWPAILSENDLSVVNKPIEFIPGIKFTQAGGLNKTYFIPSMVEPFLLKDAKPRMAERLKTLDIKHPYTLKETDYVYLWDKPNNPTESGKEIIPYKAFVSPYGKVILSFPEKLPIDSDRNIYSQEYVKQSALFLKNKFFWTKMEVVVR